MRNLTALVALALTVSCADPLAPPAQEPIQPQLVARTGFLLQQIDARDRAIRDHADAMRALREELAAAQSAAEYQRALVAAEHAELERVRAELAASQETVRLRTRQVAGAFAKLPALSSETERLTRERDACFVKLADATTH